MNEIQQGKLEYITALVRMAKAEGLQHLKVGELEVIPGHAKVDLGSIMSGLKMPSEPTNEELLKNPLHGLPFDPLAGKDGTDV